MSVVDQSSLSGLNRFAKLLLRPEVVVALLVICYVTWQVIIETSGNWRMVALVVLGTLIGATLLITRFGFAFAFRMAVRERDFSALRAHLLMLGVGSLLMVPLIAHGSLFGKTMAGLVAPIGFSFVAGGLLFGIGMQMARGCASGTLFLLASGDLTFLITLIFFIFGSAIGVAHLPFWYSLPAFPPITVFSLGPWQLWLVIELLLLAWLWFRIPCKTPVSRSLLVGAILLAVLNFLTLVIAGRPWSETSGFALWGMKIAGAIGFHPETWDLSKRRIDPSESIFGNMVSIMDFALIGGALLAAGLTRRFKLRLDTTWREWLLAALGGFLMGYGARLSSGCNIGAYFSTIVTGGISGYLWAILALVGTFVEPLVRRMLLLGKPQVLASRKVCVAEKGLSVNSV